MRGGATRGGLSSLCPYPLAEVRHLPVFSSSAFNGTSQQPQPLPAAAFALMTLKGWIKVAQLEKKEKQLLGIA